MPLINRFTRLFTADMHAVLDRIEEPDVLLRQAVREMESELTQLQQKDRAVVGDAERAAEFEARVNTDLKEIDEELDICFAADEEQLARSLIRRKLELAKRRAAAEQHRHSALKEHAELERAINEAQEKLTAMQEKLALLTDEQGERGDRCESPVGVNADEIEVAFLREKQRRRQA